MTKYHESLLQLIEGLDVRARRNRREDLLLDSLQLRLDTLQQREIAIDDCVHQRIQNVARATAQQLRLVFGACTHILKSSLDAAAHRQDVVVPDEDGDLTDPQLTVNGLDHVQDCEDQLAVLFDLRSLMAVPRIFDRERMQVELGLHQLQRARVRFQQCDPDETTGLHQIAMDVLRLDIRELPPVLIRHAADQHRSSPLPKFSHRTVCPGRSRGPTLIAMRIAQVSLLHDTVAPWPSSNAGRAASYLIEELVSEGHEVTLFSSDDWERPPNFDMGSRACSAGRRTSRSSICTATVRTFPRLQIPSSRVWQPYMHRADSPAGDSGTLLIR